MYEPIPSGTADTKLLQSSPISTKPFGCFGQIRSAVFRGASYRRKEQTVNHFSKLVWSTAIACALVVAMGSPAAAQGKTEIAAGYHFANASAGGTSTSYPAGWFADVGFPLSGPLSIVGSIDGSYKSESQTFPFIGTIDISQKIHTFGGGVRYGLAPSGKMTPFVHR